MKDWREEYRRKLISAEEAARLIKSGDTVSFTLGREAHTVGKAIAARKQELHHVKILVPFPEFDFGWYGSGWEGSFDLTIYHPTALSQKILNEKRCDLEITDILCQSEGTQRKSDVVITEVSSPDEKGFCSFGASLWNKKQHIKKGKVVIAEVNENLIRTYGDNYVHISEIDYFVKHESTRTGVGKKGSLAGKASKVHASYLRQIAEHLSKLIQDGDTIQIGVGRTTEPLVELGLFDNKSDIGYHSETTPPGVIPLVREGIITGKFKTIHTGKVVVSSIGGASKEDMDWVNGNPIFWLVDVGYLWDIRTISAHDNMVAINNALSVDLTGQIASENIGTRMFGSSGGQTAFALGALLSKGGHSIIVLPSTAVNGSVSRIVATLPPGTAITVPRNCADIIVTEYGIASIRGKSLRRRAEELIGIAHPDFRPELAREAKKLYWPS
jgi:4-hydroxybutyrate CoA-transferase